jgi:hypothetical protein
MNYMVIEYQSQNLMIYAIKGNRVVQRACELGDFLWTKYDENW